jgi:transposase-like protein
LKKAKIKYQFSVKDKDELAKLSYEELLQYTKNLTDDWHKNKKKPKKDSTNSSLPTSTDIAPPKKKRNQSLRKKGGKNGGQFGHKGTTLKQSDTPDEIVDIEFNIDNCQQCGYDLSNILKELKEKRQVLDLNLKDTLKKITQYQSYSKTCPKCVYENHDNLYPNFVAPHISYGKNIMAIVTYLNIVHYVSYKRIVQTLKTMYKINISEGTVDNLIKKASKFSQNEINKIVSQLKLSDIVGIDETGVKVNGSRDWHWVFQNDMNTFIVHNESRGTKVIDEHFPNGFEDAIVVHDNYSSYNNLIASGEQLCLAHKLRDLNYAIECDNTKIMKDIKILLQEAMIDHKEDLSQTQRDILKQQYEQTFEYLLTRPAIKKSETHKQINSLTKARDKIFTFLLHPNIPADNNGSERAIRNLKVKLKVSQQFKSPQGAKDYATLRSIIDTARKRDLNEFEAIRDIIGGKSIF